MREAQAYLTRKLRERDLGPDVEGAKITLNEYLDRWLETAVKPRVREKTCHDYEGVLRRYIRPNFGERVLAGMRPLGSANYVSADDERGLSAWTVRYTHVVLRSALLQALHWRLLLENPADRIKLPQQPRCEMRALTLEQARMLAVALTTGMRPSEYLGLECQDINWERQTVSVVHSVRRRDGRWRLTDTKRPRSRRLIRTPHNNTADNSCPEATYF